MSRTAEQHWRLQQNVTLRRRRAASLPGRVMVQEGDLVEAGQEIVRVREMFSVPHLVNVARRVEERPSRLSQEDYNVKEGDRVRAGETLLEVKRSTLMVFRSIRRAKSPVAGVVESIYRELGLVLIREDRKQETASVTLDIAERIGCSGDDITDYLRVEEGEEVQQGQIIAVDQGDVRRSVLAPYDGQIGRIDRLKGAVVLQRSVTGFSVDAFVPGRVAEVIPKRGAVIESQMNRICGIYGIGGECRGTLRVLGHGSIASRLDKSMHGLVLVTEDIVTADFIFEARQCGVTAIIAAGMRVDCLYDVAGGTPDVTIDSPHLPGPTVVLTEGFGEQLRMDGRIYAMLSKFDGEQAYLDGTTQIRAGVVRPEILLPAEDDCTGEGALRKAQGELKSGDRVVVLRGPQFMRRGIIIRVLHRNVQLGFGISGPAARVRLDGGGEVVALQANLEREV